MIRRPARRPSSRTGAALLAAAAVVLWADRAAAIELTGRERAGKKIFLEGVRPSGGEIMARLGREGAELPASSVPCGSCHGEDGLGRAEGGTRPSPITWSELTKAYGHVHPARKHGPFDARTFARAVTDGVDPAGNALDAAMPIYAMTPSELANLAAYLKVLERDIDPGISASEIRIGTILPARGPTAELGLTMRKVIESDFETLNRGGGINGRKLRLVVGGYDPAQGADGALAAARRLLSKGQVLALVSGFFPVAEPQVFDLADREHVPVVGPLTLYASQAGTPSAWVFHLLAGVREQARVLADFAAEKLKEWPPVAVVHAEDARLAAAAAGAKARFVDRGFPSVEVVPYSAGRLPASIARDLAAKGAQAVVFLGDDSDLSAFLRSARDVPFTPYLLLPGGLAARAAMEAPAGFQGRIFLAYPTVPGDEKPDAQARLAAMDLPAGHRNLAVPINADAAATVLAEGLRRLGRNVSRRSLVTSLEGLYQFEPGLVPAITYGPTRRVGALGAYVLAADLEARTFRPVGGWRGLE